MKAYQDDFKKLAPCPYCGITGNTQSAVNHPAICEVNFIQSTRN